MIRYIEKNKKESAIIDISKEAGFQSHDVFTRAFMRVYGVTPKKYRQGKTPVPIKRQLIEEGKPVTNVTQMEFCIFDSLGFDVFGIEGNAKIWDEDGSIGKLWREFIKRADERNPNSVVMYGIYEHENCDSRHMKYMAVK